MINIGRDNNDANYRYKMSRIVGKVEGRGNGIKTVIDNCDEVSEQLNRPPEYLTKFLGIELAAQSRWRAAENRSIVNGAHQDSDLQTVVHKFVDIFVLCPTCNYPETKLKISTKNKTITHHCRACGSKNMINITRHKLCTFILKEAKKQKKKSKEEKSSKDKKSKKDKKGKKKDKERRSKKDAEVAAAEDVTKTTKDKVEFETDTTAEAVAARRAEEMAKSLPQQKFTPAESLDFSSKQLQECMASGIGLVKLIGNLSRLQSTYSLPVHARLVIFTDAVMSTNSTPKEFVESVRKYSSVFTQLVRPDMEDPRGQQTLLSALERFFCKNPKVRPVVPLVLQAFYSADILDDEQILKWYGHDGPLLDDYDERKTGDVLLVKEASKKLIDWLEEEDDGEEDDESDEDE